MMKSLFIVLAFLMQAVGAHAQSVRETIRLDKAWKFSLGHARDPQKDFGCGTEYFNYLTKANSIHNEGPYTQKFDDSAWQEIQIPHDWVTTLPYAKDASHSHGYKTVGWKYPETSVGWYRKSLHIGNEDLGKRLMLRFDGIFRNAQVWFNGFYMGTEPSGYATQIYDITPYVKYGEQNLICVRADASLEEGWFYEGAGIYRDVWLLKSAEVSVAPFGIFVYAKMCQPYTEATLSIETEVNNSGLEAQQCEVIQMLYDHEDKLIGESETASLFLNAKQTLSCKQSIQVNRPHLWSTTDPYLYHVKTVIKQNGRIVDVEQTTAGIRDIAFDAERGFLLNGEQLKLKGVNLHQDHAGVGSAIPDALQAWRIKQLKKFGCNAYRSSHNPMTPAMLDVCDREGILVIDENRLMGINEEHLRLLERMIKRDRNHPSIILWSDGNEEWGIENNIQGTRLAAAMREYTRLYDPTRRSTVANAGGSELIKGVDVAGFNYISQNDVDNRKKANPTWAVVGTEEFTGCGTRGWYFESPDYPGRMVSTNRSKKIYDYENVIERGWQFYADRPWGAGVFYWTGFDYRGESNPLVYPAHDSEYGILDYCGFPKDEAYYLKSWWTDEPTLHIFPHWNLQGHEGEDVEIWAYSNCDEVELVVNGKKLGRQQMPKNGHLKWNAVYQPGKVVAYGYKNGKRMMTQTIETTKPAYKTVLKVDPQTLFSDGCDIAVVTVEVQDQKGRVVPDACPMLHFTLEGEGRILGAGNGDPMYLGADHPKDKDCREFSIPAFNGLAQIIIQGSATSSIIVNCQSDGLKIGTLSINTK